MAKPLNFYFVTNQSDTEIQVPIQNMAMKSEQVWDKSVEGRR
jgi:hypothetical protein